MAIDAASIPKDAKIAVLEKSSTESEKKIAGKSLSTFMFMQMAYFGGPSGWIEWIEHPERIWNGLADFFTILDSGQRKDEGTWKIFGLHKISRYPKNRYRTALVIIAIFAGKSFTLSGVEPEP